MLKFLNRKRANILTILLIAVLCTSIKAQQTPLATLANSDTTMAGKVINSILKVIQLFCLFIMFADCISRYQGKPKRWISVYRFVVVTYGTSMAWFIGSPYEPFAYRGFNSGFLGTYFSRMFNSDGWFGFGIPKVFSNSTVNDQETGFQLVNSLFIEMIFFFIFFLLAIATASGIKERKKISHLFGSLYYCYLLYMCFPFLFNTILFFKQHSSFNGLAASGATVNRKNYGFYLSWVASIAVFILVLIVIVYVVAEAIEMPTEIKERFGVITNGGVGKDDVKQNADNKQGRSYQLAQMDNQPPAPKKIGFQEENAESKIYQISKKCKKNFFEFPLKNPKIFLLMFI